jgi:FixJ family two-component response regulator
MGAVACLQKPVELDTLLETVRSAVAGQEEPPDES